MKKKTIDISPLLATSKRRREPNLKLIDYIKRQSDNLIEVYAKKDKEKEEENEIKFRFNDFNEKAKEKLCRLVKRDSSLITIRRQPKDGGQINIEQMVETLTILNPVIAANWSRHFSCGAFPRYKEKTLSHLIYMANKQYTHNREITSIFYKATYS